MKILSWNVWGLGNPQTLRALRFLVRSHKSQLVFLRKPGVRIDWKEKLKGSLIMIAVFVYRVLETVEA